MRNLRTLLICLPVCLVLVSGGAVYAQRDTGTIVGTVTDQSGAVVPGVTVTIRNVETNAVFSTVSDATGNYAAPLLKPGPYEVSAELPGFKKQSKSGIEVKVQDRLKVDFTLQVGNVSETVEVVGAAPKTQTETSSLGHVVDSKTTTELPLNGRNFAQLAAIAPGVILREVTTAPEQRAVLAWWSAATSRPTASARTGRTTTCSMALTTTST